MGQKTHPRGFRLGVIETWDSKWFAGHTYTRLLHEDLRLREFIKKRLYHAGISRIEIERMANKAKINIHTARPGIVIGKKGAEIVGGRGVVVTGDGDLIFDAIANLVDNAIKHGRAGGQVHVRIESTDGEPEISIADDGPGIPIDEREHVSHICNDKTFFYLCSPI